MLLNNTLCSWVQTRYAFQKTKPMTLTNRWMTAHVSGCKDCQTVLAQIDQVGQLLTQGRPVLPDLAPRADQWAAIEARLPIVKQQPSYSPSSWSPNLRAGVLCTGLIVCGIATYAFFKPLFFHPTVAHVVTLPIDNQRTNVVSTPEQNPSPLSILRETASKVLKQDHITGTTDPFVRQKSDVNPPAAAGVFRIKAAKLSGQHLKPAVIADVHNREPVKDSVKSTLGPQAESTTAVSSTADNALDVREGNRVAMAMDAAPNPQTIRALPSPNNVSAKPATRQGARMEQSPTLELLAEQNRLRSLLQ